MNFGSLKISAHWSHLVMLNYEIEPQVLQPYVPKGVILDQFNGRTLASMVGFLFRNTSVWGIPVPFHQQFEEVNLRFYVRREVDNEVRRGVVFVKEIVPKPLITTLARALYNENYVTVPMSHQFSSVETDSQLQRSRIEYHWSPPAQTFRIGASFSGDPYLPDPLSEETFISEHYYGYCSQKNGRTLEYKVEHPQWKVYRATDAQFDCEIAAFYGAQFKPYLESQPSSVFVAEGTGVTVGKSGWVN